MRSRGWIPLLLLTVTLTASTAFAAGGEEKRCFVTPFGGWTKFDDANQFSTGEQLKDSPYYGGRAGVRLISDLWIEAAGGYTRSTPDVGGDDVEWYHASGSLLFAPFSPHPVNPFISVGGGYLKESHKLVPDVESGIFDVAGGLHIRVTDMIGIRLEARNLLRVPKERWETSKVNDLVLGGGLDFAFGGGKKKDADGDGVADKLDKCPGTPHGCTVDATGCPHDADADGVCDGLDKCPNTPAGAKVDASGCPHDADGDGVYDGIDLCEGTTSGCKVDAKGCPTDSDGDGVCDGVDTCPNTPKGCTVDAVGCPTDADGDGVCDGLDRCANTPAGAKVDKDGCPIEVVEKETQLLETGLIRIENIHFETGKADIMTEDEPALQVVGQVLGKWPELKIEVGGHTDARGAATYNQKLSEERASSVRDYLLKNFPNLHAEQLTVKGYGESLPLVPNTNQLNMAKNRRVEFKVLNKEQLKREVERRRMLQRGEGAPSDTTRR